MPGLENDLNQEPPKSGQNHSIDWDGIVEWDGPAHELDYYMVWDDEIHCSHLLILLFCYVFILFMISFLCFLFDVLGDEDQGADGVK